MNKFIFFFLLVVCFNCTPDEESVEPNVKPDPNRFEIELVVENLNQPMSMDILDDGRIFFVEKDGAVKVVDPKTFKVTTIAEIPVNSRFSVPFTTSGSKFDADDGMHGIVLDPDFNENGFIYLYYSPLTKEPISQVVRYTFRNNSFDQNSKVVLLEWETQRERCCHWGGGMVFDEDGNLLISTGDNSGGGMNTKSGDARRTSGSSNDLRGSILRIHPKSDGTYSIPGGNLFPDGKSNTRPEIYIMGVRNPWRLSMDTKTGWLYWGEVGPSTDEFNLAKEAGNFGWPFFIANNVKYLSTETTYDTAHIINESPFNTGIKELPVPPVPSLVWYDRNPSEEFPIPGSGSLSAVGGPIFRISDFSDAERLFPSYFEGKWFVTDYVRGWIMTIEVDESGRYKSMEEFLPEFTFTGINDLDFGPDGDLYVLQYGHDSYAPYARDAKIFRIKYNDGNRKPIAKATGKNTSGSVPLQVELDANGSVDFDNNIQHYEWIIESEARETVIYEGENHIVDIDEEGMYNAILTVTDSEGEKDMDTLKIIAGNNAPEIAVDFKGSNSSFYFSQDKIEYSIQISDNEDSIIDTSRINSWADFLPAGYDLEDFLKIMGSSPGNFSAKAIIGKNLISQNNCYQCHTLDRTAVGPSYKEVANKYRDDSNVYPYLTNKIMTGSIGVWGQAEMPSHPSISLEQASYIVDFILEVTNDSQENQQLPLMGSIPVLSDISDVGDLVFKVSYQDNGNGELPEITTDKIEVLKNPSIFISSVDTFYGMRIYTPHFKQLNHLITNSKSAFIGLKDVDLTQIKQVGLEIINLDKLMDSNWELSIRSGSPQGQILASTKWTDVSIIDDNIAKISIDSAGNELGLYISFNHDKNETNQNEIEIRSIRFYK